MGQVGVGTNHYFQPIKPSSLKLRRPLRMFWIFELKSICRLDCNLEIWQIKSRNLKMTKVIKNNWVFKLYQFDVIYLDNWLQEENWFELHLKFSKFPPLEAFNYLNLKVC